MTMPAAWTVIRWPEVKATLGEFERAAASMRPVSVSVLSDSEEQTRSCGQALWAGEICGQPIGIAWDWAEVTQSVVAMVDPMRVLTNVVLTDEDERIIDDRLCVLYLNRAIYGLPWQDEVLHVSQPQPQRLAA